MGTTSRSKRPSAHARCAHLRLETELVGVGAGDAPLVGDALRALELRRELVVLAVRGGGRAAEVAAGRRAERDAAHRLDAARQRDVDHARLHERGREVGGLLRRSALRVDGAARDLEREAGAQPRVPRDVERLLADLAHAAADHLADEAGIDAGPLDHGALHGREQIDGVHGRQAAVAAPERRAGGFDDDDVLVGDRSQRELLEECRYWYGAWIVLGSSPARDLGAKMHRMRRIVVLASCLALVLGLGATSKLDAAPRRPRRRARPPPTPASADDKPAGCRPGHDDHDRRCPNPGRRLAVTTRGRSQPAALLTKIGGDHAAGAGQRDVHVPGQGLRGPSCKVEYQPGPFSQDGSGAPVTVAGSAFVVVRCYPAYGFDFETGTPTYTGPKRIEATGHESRA